MPSASPTRLGLEVVSHQVGAEDPLVARKRVWVGRHDYLFQGPALARSDMIPISSAFSMPCKKRPKHKQPAMGCTCGVPASKADRFWGSGPVAVMVKGWGTVVEHERGYRFERAQLVAVIDEHRFSPVEDAISLQRIAERYDVEVWPT